MLFDEDEMDLDSDFDPLSNICQDNDPENLVDYFKEPTTLAFQEKINKFDIEKLIHLLEKISVSVDSKSEYNKKHRATAFLIHARLTHQGIAPVWRNIKKFKQIGDDALKAAYAADLQIFDLYWAFVHHKDIKVKHGKWDDLFKGIFTSDEFDYNQAYQISRSTLTAKEKIKNLRLTESVQEELAVLRSDTVRKRIERATADAEKIEDILIDAGKRDARQKRKPDDLEKCRQVWLAHKMSRSDAEALRKYKQMSGMEINDSTYRSKIKTIQKTRNAAKARRD